MLWCFFKSKVPAIPIPITLKEFKMREKQTTNTDHDTYVIPKKNTTQKTQKTTRKKASRASPQFDRINKKPPRPESSTRGDTQRTIALLPPNNHLKHNNAPCSPMPAHGAVAPRDPTSPATPRKILCLFTTSRVTSPSSFFPSSFFRPQSAMLRGSYCGRKIEMSGPWHAIMAKSFREVAVACVKMTVFGKVSITDRNRNGNEITSTVVLLQTWASLRAAVKDGNVWKLK